jgi:hypothetical protein
LDTIDVDVTAAELPEMAAPAGANVAPDSNFKPDGAFKGAGTTAPAAGLLEP